MCALLFLVLRAFRALECQLCADAVYSTVELFLIRVIKFPMEIVMIFSKSADKVRERFLCHL